MRGKSSSFGSPTHPIRLFPRLWLVILTRKILGASHSHIYWHGHQISGLDQSLMHHNLMIPPFQLLMKCTRMACLVIVAVDSCFLEAFFRHHFLKPVHCVGVQLFWQTVLLALWGLPPWNGARIHGLPAFHGGWQWGKEIQLHSWSGSR